MDQNIAVSSNQKIALHTETPFQSIGEALLVVELAFRLQNGFQEGLIAPVCFTKNVILDTATGTHIKERISELVELKIVFDNLVLSAIAGLSIAIDRALDQKLGSKEPSKNDSINSLRAAMYMLRCALSHDIAHPKWRCEEKYQKQVYVVIIPKEIGQRLNPKIVSETSLKFDFKELNTLTVTKKSFYGIEGLIACAFYALSLVEEK